MNNNIYDNPEAIYQYVNGLVIDISDKIKSIKKDGGHNVNGDIQDEIIHQIISSLQDKISISIHHLKSNAEWKTFQIAFFGETNAGKSTIIETLRILLDEPSKIEQQNKFKEIANSLDISVEKFYQMQNELEELNAVLNQLGEQKTLVEQKYANQLNDVSWREQQTCQKWDSQISEASNQYQNDLKNKQRDINKLEIKIEKIKANMNWFLKIIYIFIKMNEQKELFILENELEEFQYEMNDVIEDLQRKKSNEVNPILNQKQTILNQKKQEIVAIEENIQAYTPKKQSLEQWFAEFNGKKQRLLPYVDGQIMGDGRSDFTRESTYYQFEINNYPVSMIDVPGIEGNEKVVKDEITKAVQKTHAVFYVTSKDAPPNEGTLERIQSYLNDQTEVWAIYNKQITNPRQLNKALIHNDDEQQSLNDLELKLKETLGSHYCGLITLAGLPAFFSRATCIEPFSIMYDQQNKFLDKLGQDGLYRFSQLQALENKLKQHIVGYVPAKIKRSNFNKVKVLLDDSRVDLIKIHETYEHYEQDLNKKITIANQSIRGYFNDFEMAVKGQSEGIIGDFQRKCRNEIYDYIDKDISNDDFKSGFNRVLENQSHTLESQLKEMIERHSKELEENIMKAQKELIRQVNALGGEYKQYSQFNNDGMSLSFNLDSGINKLGLLGVAISIGAAMWWNPVGWLAISATVAGLAIAFLKSISGFFSSDYKKQQQRKNVDSNLPKVTSKIRTEIDGSLSNLLNHLSNSQKKITQDLHAISLPIKQLNQDLNASIKSLEFISSQIDTNR